MLVRFYSILVPFKAIKIEGKNSKTEMCREKKRFVSLGTQFERLSTIYSVVETKCITQSVKMSLRFNASFGSDNFFHLTFKTKRIKLKYLPYPPEL